MNETALRHSAPGSASQLKWVGKPKAISQSTAEAASLLGNLLNPLYVLKFNESVLLEGEGTLIASGKEGIEALGVVNPVSPTTLGSPEFCQTHKTHYPMYAGAMANAINSIDMVVALGKEGILSSFGAGGLSVAHISKAIDAIKSQLASAPFAINLLHNPSHPSWEMDCVNCFIEKGVTLVEASAYINLSPAIVYYRLAGMNRNAHGDIVCKNKIIAKVSRPEVARRFLEPAPENIVKKLVKSGLVTQAQADMAKQVPVADDITVESDSGGHTDNGILSCIFPEIANLRVAVAKERRYKSRPRVGAAGGIGTPHAAYAAFSLGADFIVTGSINQACNESGTSESARHLLKTAGVADCVSAPSADMFELGAKVQVLKSGSMYGVRAQKLYNLYKQYDSLDAIPKKDLENLEKTLFLQPLSKVWADTKAFFASRDMVDQITKAEQAPKRKMALVFQWYLGQSSKWAISGEESRALDFQIWCGPAMGACNQWLSGSHLEVNRPVVDINENIIYGAAYLARLYSIKLLGVQIPDKLQTPAPRDLTHIRKVMPRILEYVEESMALSGLEYANSTTGQENMSMNSMENGTSKLSMNESKSYYKKTWDLLPGGAHYNFGDPQRSLVIPFNKGRGTRVWDLDGNEHLDLFCKFGAMFVGHNNLEYHGALRKYMDKVTSVDTCDLEYDVCKTLTTHIPCAEMVRFALSGTEAVQNALRLARAYTGKNRFIRFHGHYHGNADNVMGGRKRADLTWPTPEMFKGDLLDTKGRADHVLEEQSFMLPWNDIDALETTLRNHGDKVAAVLMEPICMNGGGILPRKNYLQQTKDLCEKHNVVLIFDEIITGVRVGLGGAQKILGVTPHLATFAKALGGGSMPISAIVGHKDLMNQYTKGHVIHAGTFNGYPLGLAAIQATYEIIENDPGCYDRMGKHMADISRIFVKSAVDAGLEMVVQGMPTALVYHSQDHLVDRSEGYSDKTKFSDIIIREVAKRFGLQFSPLSRLYPNIMLNESDVEFFAARIGDTMAESKKMIDVTFKEEALA